MRLRPQIGYLASTSLLNSLCDPTSLLNSLCSPTRILNSLRSPTRILNSLLNLIQIQKCTSINPSTLLHQTKSPFQASLFIFSYTAPLAGDCSVTSLLTKPVTKTVGRRFTCATTHSYGTWLIHVEHDSFIWNMPHCLPQEVSSLRGRWFMFRYTDTSWMTDLYRTGIIAYVSHGL